MENKVKLHHLVKLAISIKSICQTTEERYLEYWKQTTPKSEGDILDRICYAICSVHTGWKVNVRQYKNLTKYRWKENKYNILPALKLGGGMFNQKTRALTELLNNKRYYLANTDPFEFRDNLTNIPCLGMAKASFASELIHPTKSNIPVCLDTHVLQWLGEKEKNGKMNRQQYLTLENDFQTLSNKTFIARNILWDSQQNEENPRYWSHPLEPKQIQIQ